MSDVKLIPLTPEVIDKMQRAMTQRKADIAARYPKLVTDSPYETRLAITAWVFEHIVAHAYEGGSFRHLIYSRLGFGPDAYLPLYLAGGMTISNEYDQEGQERDLDPTDPASAVVDAVASGRREIERITDRFDLTPNQCLAFYDCLIAFCHASRDAFAEDIARLTKED